MRPYIIAEIGVNFYDIATQRDISPLEAAKLMIAEAHKGGAHAAKFQSYKAGKIASKHSPAYWDQTCEPTSSQFELFQKFDHFGPDEYTILADYAKEIGIDFMSTPFDLEAVDFLDPLMSSFKVASADITNYPLLEKIASKDKPMLLSTGASTQDEIKGAVAYIKSINSEISITLLHCVLNYPTPFEHANLRRIQTLAKNFPGYELGYSDHTLPDAGMSICTAAYTLGAFTIEKHFTLDKSLTGNDHYHSMDIEDLKVLRENLDNLYLSKQIHEDDYLPSEEKSRLHARRSIVIKRDMKTGEKISLDDVIMKRPGHGISPIYIKKIVGETLLKDISEDSLLTDKHLKL